MRYNIRLGYDAWRLLSAYSEPGDILSRIMERRGSNVDIINVDLAAHEADALASLAYDVMYRTSGATEGEKRTAQAIYEEIGHGAALSEWGARNPQYTKHREMQDSPAIQSIRSSMEHRSRYGAHNERKRKSGDVGHRRGIRSNPDFLRHVVLNTPGGKYQLWMWDTGRHDHRGQPYIRYDFIGPDRRSIFAGEDFAGSPMDAIDSDASVGALLGFLTLRPGDTDREYFGEYTPAQMAFAESGDAEFLQNESQYRFDKEYRNEVRRENRRRR